MVNVRIHRTDFSTWKDYATINIIGKRRSGKTTFAKHMVSHLADHYDRAVVMCGSMDTMNEWSSEVVHPLFVHMWDERKLEQIQKYQMKRVAEYTREHGEHCELPKRLKLLIVIDDKGYDRKAMESKVIVNLTMNSRHCGASVVICAQDFIQLPTVLRSNTDYACILFSRNSRVLKYVHSEFMSKMVSQQVFSKMLNICTMNRGVMVIDNTINSDEMSDFVSFYNVDQKMKLNRIGNNNYVKWADEHFIPENEKLKLNDVRHKRRGRSDGPVSAYGSDEESTVTYGVGNLIRANQTFTFEERNNQVICITKCGLPKVKKD